MLFRSEREIDCFFMGTLVGIFFTGGIIFIVFHSLHLTVQAMP